MSPTSPLSLHDALPICFLDLGDLTWNIEYKLVHPSDKIGPIDLYQSTHHGLEISNNPVVIKTVKPDRKSTRLNSSHVSKSYAVSCLKKKNVTKHYKLD